MVAAVIFWFFLLVSIFSIVRALSEVYEDDKKHFWKVIFSFVFFMIIVPFVVVLFYELKR